METNSWQARAAPVDSTFERRSDSRLEIQNERTARHRLVQLALVAAVVYLPIGYMYWQGMSATSGSSILEIVQLIAQHVFSSLPLTAMAMYAALRLRDWRIHLLLSIGYFLMVLVGANAASLGMFRMAPNMAIVFFLISLETFANQTLAIGLFARIIGVRIIALGEPIARFRPFGISGMLIATALIAGMLTLRKVLGRLVAEQVPDFAFMYGEESLVAMALFVYTLGNAALLIALLSRKRLVFWLAVVFYIPLHLGLSLAYLKYLTSLIESLNNSSVGVAHPEIWMQALFSLASLLEILFVRWLFHLAGLRVVIASDRHP